jgi:signal transduction histidine kinase
MPAFRLRLKYRRVRLHNSPAPSFIMPAPSISSERVRSAAQPEPFSELSESSTHPALTDPQQLLRRANAELELLYAVEQQLNASHALPDLIGAVLERVCSLMRFEAAALLVIEGATAEVFSYQRGSELRVRPMALKDAQLRVSEIRTTQRRLIDAAGQGSEPLCDLPSRTIQESYDAPVIDGSAHCGVLQAVQPSDLPDSEHTILRRLGLVAAQLGRAIVLRREREAIVRSERLNLLGQSIGAIMHDIRTPLTAVSGYIDVMAGAESPELRREYAERAGRGLAQVEHLVQDVLAFARGQREVLATKVQLGPFIEDVRELLKPELERAGASLEVIADYSGSARFDENKLKRVLWNLARNAVEAGAKQFTWRCARTGEYLVFECTDTGPGMPAAMEGKLFEAFASHGKIAGTGLGLSMAKKIVDAHCGRIQVRSEPGRGTVFRIELPI